jgi:hypothetical protein
MDQHPRRGGFDFAQMVGRQLDISRSWPGVACFRQKPVPGPPVRFFG